MKTRPRKHSPDIPAHINQSKLPNGVYFDKRGRGRWYVQYRDEAGKLKTERIAGADATLSELHRIMEQRSGIDAHQTGQTAGGSAHLAILTSTSAAPSR